jgi:hypothetical protein
MRKNILLAITITGIIALPVHAEIKSAFFTLGGGYPYGIVNDLNTQFKTAYDQTKAAYGASSDDNLTTASGKALSLNYGLGFFGTEVDRNKMQYGIDIGYSYSSVGDAKYTNAHGTVTGSYGVHEIRVVPMLFSLYEASYSTKFTLGAGAEYAIVNYTVSSDVANSSGMPGDASSSYPINSSGLTWVLWGTIHTDPIGLEVAVTGVNSFYIGLEIGVAAGFLRNKSLGRE